MAEDQAGSAAGAGRGERFKNITPEQREKLRERFKSKQADGKSGDAEKKSTAPARAFGGGGDQQAIFEWVKQATTAFWDSALKGDLGAGKFLQSDALSQLSNGAVKLERK
ncbi:MAG: hypothetical protein HC841_00720 [Verrucomicrobiae bacterium]|nr:hypothetical protein [Verrucomicrobiae bacterium]